MLVPLIAECSGACYFCFVCFVFLCFFFFFFFQAEDGIRDWSVTGVQTCALPICTTTLTITVNDGTNITTDSFTVDVEAVNDVPTIEAIADQTVDEDGVIDAIAIRLDDLELDPDNLDRKSVV